MKKDKRLENKPSVPVAIIGIGCFFPKSPGLKEYWRLIYNATDAIVEVPSTHWSPDDYFSADPSTPDHTYCTRGGFLPPVTFDPTEFGIPPNSLEATDTSQLLGLLAAKAALSDAGYNDGKEFDRERTSVILGVTGTQELVIPLGARLGFPKWRQALDGAGVEPETAEEVIRRISATYVPWKEGSFPGLLGNVVAGRISNRLDLRGTNCVVDAACASSLSAVHMALLEITSGRSDMVVTGGVDTLNDIFMHMCFAKTHILSPTGDARPFSSDADGTVLGEGIGLLVLKRLAEAEKDGDRIYAVIRGIGSSSDGKSQSIYAPRADGQAVALRRAYDQAGIDPSTVELIETHGTGTKVGDAVEFNALRQVFTDGAVRNRKCAIGSVKSMIGHTKAAAGAAGLIKGVLALHHKVLPPTLKAERPDPKLDVANSPFYINTTSQPWRRDPAHPRRCGVSAFGFGGSNFHIVLEEHRPEKTDTLWDGSIELIALSSSSKAGLMRKVQALKQELADGHTLPDAAARSRRSFSIKDSHRILWALDHLADQAPETVLAEHDFLETGLQRLSGDTAADLPSHQRIYTGEGPPKGKLAFLFPGQGSQYPAMGRDLVCRFPAAFESLEAVCRTFDGKESLWDAIYPPMAATAEEQRRQIEILRRTDITQPAIGGVNLAMLKVLASFGVTADATAGHSFGELTALHAAGWIDEPTYLALAVTRGRLMADARSADPAAASSMLAVKVPLEKLADLIAAQDLDVVLANRNAPDQGVLSGTIAALETVEAACRRSGYSSMMLPVSAGFHSHLVESAREPFAEALKMVTVTPGPVPVFSNSTGQPYPSDPSAVVALLADQLRTPVDFVSQVKNMADSGVRFFIEVGPRTILSGLVEAILAGKNISTLAMDASAGKRSGLGDLAHALCRLAAAGYPVQLDRWESSSQKRRLPLLPIPLTGANHRTPSTSSFPPPPAPKNADRKHTRPNPNDGPGKGGSSRRARHTAQPVNTDGHSELMKNTHTTPDPDVIKQALFTVQQSLESMQALQRQTAEAHHKFLDTQQEAGRTLQQMLEHSRRMAEFSMGEQPAVAAPLAPSVSTAAAETDRTGRGTDATVVPRTASSTIRPAAAAIIEQTTPRMRLPDSPAPSALATAGGAASPPAMKPDAASDNTLHLHDTLLAVVSELTGYPADMINLDMDIEADLGIDSIKRVEILSTLEERASDIPAVSPDLIARMKTLRQVADLLSGSVSKAPGSVLPLSPIDGGGTRETDDSRNRQPQDGLLTVLLGVVSELTGYPVDMIGADMDIEADLGIDSIMRVEILSALEEKVPHLPTVTPDQMGKLKTLQQIVEYLSDVNPAPLPAGTDQSSAETVAESPRQEPGTDDTEPRPDQSLSRQIVRLVEKQPGKRLPVTVPAGRKVYITEDGSGLSAAIADKLSQSQINTVLISTNILNYKENLPPAAGLIVVMSPDDPAKTDKLKDIFRLTSHLAPELKTAALQGGALFATVSRLDGAFGFHGQGIAHPLQGALAGLAKTAAIEWDGVNCRAFDVAPERQDHDTVAALLADELLGRDPDDAVEVGLGMDRRYGLELRESPLPASIPVASVLTSDDVVIVTGGARGVTAAAATALAAAAKPRLILLGRSPEPFVEPEWLQGLEDEAELKRAIRQHGLKGKGSPSQLETAYREYAANREIKTTLADISQTGADVRYISVDIRDAAAVQRIISQVTDTAGPVKTIIHGAGILEDRLIEDKTPDQFQRVFETKVRGLENLLAAVNKEALTHLVLFSSISGRMGNRGQADYAMANEALNKIAQQYSVRNPRCRVVAINWGPWDGGMVTEGLKREFHRRGVTLIPTELGARQVVAELFAGGQTPAEVVIGGPTAGGAEDSPYERTTDSSAGKSIDAGLSLTFWQDVDLSSHPVLRSHVIGGKPVVPLALITEWLGHGALHENPGLQLQGLDDIRVLKGIKLDGPQKHVRLLAGRANKSGGIYEVPVEIRDGVHGNVEVVHSKAKAILADTLEPAPKYRIPKALTRSPYKRPMSQVYQDILFHGPDLHGIREITHLSSEGMIARLNGAPSPSQWLKEPLRNKWLTDPLALDAAFQMATVWCYEEQGVVSLPSYCTAYRQFRTLFPAEGLTAVLEIDSVGSHKMRGSIVFLDKDGLVVAQISGFEAVMDPSLHRAFKPAAA